VIRLRHNRIELALHVLQKADQKPPLLLLHGLGERTPSTLPDAYESWPGPIFALDFTGHGQSSVPAGGGYTAELLMADVDAALAHTGPTTLAGRGLGAYIAVLIAGARPTAVQGAVLCDGPGLAGGGSRPGTARVLLADPGERPPPDPYALAELTQDVRPPDYATSFVRQANELSGLERPVSVVAVERPDWLRAVVDEPGVEETTLDLALEHYARHVAGR
jgi:pimeloyl-ACP methyl ester carboxylesterase